jgi:hypothetical protein
MAKFTLSIETEEAVELRDIVSRIAGGAVASAPAAVEPTPTIVVVEAPAPTEKPKAAPKAEKAKAKEAPLASSSSAAQAASSQATDIAPASNTAVATATTVGEKTSQDAPADVSYDAVKQALITLMDKKSASVVQGMLKDKFGVVAISQLDKAKYGEALAALTEWAA